MRKALLVLAMIAASFAGGAAVNGPGLAILRDSLGLSAPRIDGDPFDPAHAPPDSLDPTRPAAHDPPIRPASPPPQPSTPHPPASEASSSDPGPSLAPPTPTPPSSPSHGWGDAPGSPPARPATSRDPLIHRTQSPQPPSPPSPEPNPTDSAPPLLEPPDEPARWADLVARMKAFNVTRYWVEGPPDGPITFRCAIPLAGGNAVTHHFEAQGADLADAADAALNRIALWRASEPAEPPQK